MIALLTL